MSIKIRIGNLNGLVTTSLLAELLGQYGSVKRIRITERMASGRCIGIVTMRDDARAAAAIVGLQGSKIEGRAITLRRASPRSKKPRTSDLGEGRSGGSTGRFGSRA